MIIQPRGPKRKRVGSAVDKRIREAVTRDSIRWDCSRSWIIATALAAFYGIDIIKPSEYKKIRKRKAA